MLASSSRLWGQCRLLRLVILMTSRLGSQFGSLAMGSSSLRSQPGTLALVLMRAAIRTSQALLHQAVQPPRQVVQPGHSAAADAGRLHHLRVGRKRRVLRRAGGARLDGGRVLCRRHGPHCGRMRHTGVQHEFHAERAGNRGPVGFVPDLELDPDRSLTPSSSSEPPSYLLILTTITCARRGACRCCSPTSLVARVPQDCC